MAHSAADIGAPPWRIGYNCNSRDPCAFVLGCEPDDMAAVNRAFEIGGGIVLVESGAVFMEVPLECGVPLSTAPGDGSRADERFECLPRDEVALDDPFFGMNFLTFTGLPFIRLTASGLLDAKTGLLGYP